MRALTFSAALLAALQAGCGSKADPSETVVPAPPPVPPGLPTDDVNYAAWKKFPVGTTVKRRVHASNPKSAVSTTSVETLTLTAVQADELVVERQNTTTRSDGSVNAVNPPGPHTYRRQFALPPGMAADDFRKPSRSAKAAGEEAVAVLGKEYKATKYTWTDPSEAGPIHITCWISDDFPGRVVKQVMVQPDLGNTTTDEVVELTVPKPATP